MEGRCGEQRLFAQFLTTSCGVQLFLAVGEAELKGLHFGEFPGSWGSL